MASSLNGGPTVPATVSFDVRWNGVRKRLWIRDEENGFVGNFIETFATVRWSAQQDGFQFMSDPASMSTTVFSVMGRESNGVFLDR